MKIVPTVGVLVDQQPAGTSARGVQHDARDVEST